MQRTLRGLNPEWKYFCKIDLKDVFFCCQFHLDWLGVLVFNGNAVGLFRLDYPKGGYGLVFFSMK